MANLFQGGILPATVTTTESQQTAPEFYTNYLQDIANLGQAAVQQGGIAGFSPLQQQAFQMAPDVAFSGAQSLGTGAQMATGAGTTGANEIIGSYMNPYTSAVVDEMGRLTQRNVMENVLPNIGAAGIGTGQYGSRRQQQITANALRDIQADLTGRQMGALQQGFTQAGQFAQTDLNRALQAAQAMGQIGAQQQQLGTQGLKTMSELGGLQQALGQKMLDYPMAQAKAFSDLLRGQSIPSGQTQQVTAPGTQGQFANSPLSQIAGLLTALGSIVNRPTTATTTTPTTTAKNGGLMLKKIPKMSKPPIRKALGGLARPVKSGNLPS